LPAVADGIVYQGDGSGGLHAFDAATGTMLWSTAFGAKVRAPAVVGGYAYLSSDDGTLYALDAKTGAERWHYMTAFGGTPSSPAVAGGSVVFNVAGVGTVALDAESGAQIWQVPFEASNIPPVIAAGVVYVSGGTSQILAFDLATGQQVGEATMASPPGLMAIAGGVLYVADFNGTLTAFVTGSATPVSQAAVAPTQPVQSSPTPVPAGVQATHLWTAQLGKDAVAAIAFAPDGTVWVQDYGGTAWIFDRDGNLLDTWGTPGSGPGELSFKIAGEASWYGDLTFAADGSFFVAECGNSRVEKFDAQRNLVLSIGTRGRGDGQFLCPTGVAIGADGDIFVADNGRNDIQRFAPDGTFLGNLGTFGYPVDLTTDRSGNLVFGEIDAQRVRVIAPDGTSVLSIGASGNTPGYLLWPNEIAVDEAGNIYVSDGRAVYVSVFDPRGVFLGTVGSEGTGDGQFGGGLTAVGHGGNGSVYVADLGTDGSGTFRIQKFKVTVTAPAAATPVA
jgi:outer membrane protein assembly factor BamB